MTRAVDAVVVNWNSGDNLRLLLADLSSQRGVDVDVVVVDNNSSDDSVARARESSTRFTLVQTGANLGFTGGNAAGLRAVALDRPVLVVNPDVRLDRDAVARLLARLDAEPRLAAVGAAFRRHDGTLEFHGSVADVERARVLHVADAPAGGEVPWIDGAAMLFRPDALHDVGFFDERFFLFQEEVDWALRARRRGWRVAVCTDVTLEHERSSSFGTSVKGSYYSWRNLYLLCSLHARGRFGWRVWWALRLLDFARRRRHLQSGASWAAMRGARDALRGAYGAGEEDRFRVAVSRPSRELVPE